MMKDTISDEAWVVFVATTKAFIVTTIMVAIKRIEVLTVYYMQFFFARKARRTFSSKEV